MKGTVKHTLLGGLVVMVMVGLLLAGCAPQAAPGPGKAAPPKPIKLRYSSVEIPTHFAAKQQRYFAEEVGKRTAGLVTVEMYFGGELYTHAQIIEAVSSGAVEMGNNSGGYFGALNPIHTFPNYLFLLASSDQYARAKDELAKILFPLIEKDGIKPLHWMAKGASAYYGRKPMVKPQDIKGMMLRGPNPEFNAALKLLGAVSSEIAPAEVYDAMAKGAIDGSFSGWENIKVRKWYEVAKYFTGPFWTPTWLVFMNMDTWKSLPADVQKTIMEVARDTEKLSFDEVNGNEKESLDVLADKGTLTILSKEQTQAWIDFVRPTYDDWVKATEKKGTGSQARDILKILEKAR